MNKLAICPWIAVNDSPSPPPHPESEVTPDETPITSTEMEHDLNPVQPPPDQQLSTETTPPAIDATITSET